MKVAIGCDDAGFPLKAVIAELLMQEYADIEVIDFGVPNADDTEYYPDVAERVARAVAEEDFDRGILMCGTGLGMAMTASKVPGIRAATCHDTYSAERARKSNNAQVLTMGSRVIGPELAKAVTKVWMESEFDPSSRSGPKVQRMVEIDAKYQTHARARNPDTDIALSGSDRGGNTGNEGEAHSDTGFFADRASLNVEDYIVLDYYFESVIDPEEAAAHLCQEQSTAQWRRVGVDEDLRDQFGAKVIDLEVTGNLDRPSYPLPSIEAAKTYQCRVSIAHPHGNFGPRIPNILTAALGEGAFYSPGIAAIKLMDIEFPASFLQHFEGPKFGIQGLRDMLEVYDRPIFFGVVKPNIGLSPDDFAELAFQSWLGGLDIAKDDEMLSDVPWSPLRERAEKAGKARLKAEEITGEKKVYLANITDEVDQLIRLHDVAVERGANALMINGMTTGLSAIRMLRKHTRAPLVAHFDFIAPLTHISYFGVHTKVMTKLQRLAGFDVIIFPGFGARMKTPDEEVLQSVQECLKPWGHIKPVLPVPAGSQWAASTAMLYERLKTIDFGIVPGRAVFAHPIGPKGGAASLRQAWDAVASGQSLEAYARNHQELQLAIESNS